MKQIIIFFTFFISSFIAYSQSDYKVKADQLLTTVFEEKVFVGVAAGFSVDGQIQWENGKGLTDIDATTTFTAKTINRTASISKPMTAIAIMQLFEQGKIDLNAPIQTYLPDFPKKSEGEITVGQLLNHASGIGAYKNKKENNNRKNYPTLASAIDLFKDRDLLAVPGKAFNYTSYGYVVLGLVIEQVSGMAYEEYLQKNIWDKAGMKQTSIEYAGKIYSNKSKVYHKNNKGKILKIKVLGQIP